MARKLDELERRVAGHDSAIVGLFEAIRGLMGPVKKERTAIGFRVEEEEAVYLCEAGSRSGAVF